jgi:hypothetical protein
MGGEAGSWKRKKGPSGERGVSHRTRRITPLEMMAFDSFFRLSITIYIERSALRL